MQSVSKIQLAAALVAAFGLGMGGAAKAANPSQFGVSEKNSPSQVKLADEGGEKSKEKSCKGKEKSCKGKESKGKESSCKGKEKSCKGKEKSCKGKESKGKESSCKGKESK